MNLNKLKYVLYIVGFILVIAPLVMTNLFRANVGDFATKIILSLGCVMVGCGKAIVIKSKKEIEEPYTTDIVIMCLLFALAGYNMIMTGN